MACDASEMSAFDGIIICGGSGVGRLGSLWHMDSLGKRDKENENLIQKRV